MSRDASSVSTTTADELDELKRRKLALMRERDKLILGVVQKRPELVHLTFGELRARIIDTPDGEKMHNIALELAAVYNRCEQIHGFR